MNNKNGAVNMSDPIGKGMGTHLFHCACADPIPRRAWRGHGCIWCPGGIVLDALTPVTCPFIHPWWHLLDTRESFLCGPCAW